MILPKAIQSVRRTKPFSISRLGSASYCLLRFVLENEKCKPMLPSVPLAQLGTSIHKILDDATKEGRKEILSDLKSELMSDKVAVSSSASSSGFVSFRDAIPTSILIKRVSAANRSFRKTPGLSPKNVGDKSREYSRDRSWLDKLAGRSVLGEERVRSEKVELVGIIDRLERIDSDSIIVEDYKTGRIFEENDGHSSLKPDYRLQLYGYALILSEKVHFSKIEMKVKGSDGEWEEQFSEEALGEVAHFVEDLQRRLPRDQEIAATQIAELGDACRYCQYRPACTAYLEWAPSVWNEDHTAQTMPHDVWGSVAVATKEEGELWDIYIAGDNGKLFRVNHVPDHLAEIPFEEGQRLYMFDLKPVGSRQQGYPQNYYVLNGQDFARSAHTATAFT